MASPRLALPTPTLTSQASMLTPLTAPPLIFHWHLRKCAGTAIRNAFAVPGASRRRPAACDRCNNCMPRCVRSLYGEHHAGFASLAPVRALERRLLSHCGSMACGLRRLVVLREPYSQLLSDVNYFPPCKHSESMETCLAGRDDDSAAMLRRYTNDYMVCGGAMMGICRATGGGCDANATLALLRRFDFVGFVEEMHHVWAVLGAWVGCHRHHSSGASGALAELARTLTKRGQEKRGRWVAKSRADYLRAARTALADDEAKVSALCGPPPISDGPLSPKQRSKRDGECSGALFGINITRVQLRALRLLPTRAQFERRNRCAIEVYRRARRELSPPTAAVRECRAGFTPLPE